jgi:hypothetical protein
MICAVLVVAAQLAGSSGTGLQQAAAALDAGRLEEAETLYRRVLDDRRSYDALVGLGVVLGQEERSSEAEQILGDAISLDPGRPEAWLERGGVLFLERRYARGVRDLRAALARGADETYTRDLLATSLHLAGRPLEALGQWNRLGQPMLRQLNLIGLRYTRADLVRAEILPVEGHLLSAAGVRETRLRLAELGVFGRVTLRAEPLGNGVADLDVAVADRHGLGQPWRESAGIAAVNLVSRLLQARYLNMFGSGTSLSGRWRWEANRPEVAVEVDWPRPLGRSGRLQLVGRRGRQLFTLGESEQIDESSRSATIRYRRVLGDRTVGFVTLGVTHRSYSRDHLQALPGWAPGLGLGSETRLFETYRSRMDVQWGGWVASGSSSRRHARASGSMEYRLALGPAQERTLQRSVIACRLAAAVASSHTPIGEWLAPGISADLEWPLRAHRQTNHGTMGVMPLTRRILLASLEWRQRIIRGRLGEVGLVPFVDAAWLGGRSYGDVARASRRQFADAGLGFRVTLPAGAVLRADAGFGIMDHARTVTVGLGQTF